jgi:pentatricopeptide repeat protein
MIYQNLSLEEKALFQEKKGEAIFRLVLEQSCCLPAGHGEDHVADFTLIHFCSLCTTYHNLSLEEKPLSKRRKEKLSFDLYLSNRAVFRQGMEKTTWRPNVVTYTTLIDAYSRRGRWEEAADMFERMKKEGRRPNMVTYTCLLNAYGAAKMMDKAEDVIEEMSKAVGKAFLWFFLCGDGRVFFAVFVFGRVLVRCCGLGVSVDHFL